jgi:hypothetical protein
MSIVRCLVAAGAGSAVGRQQAGAAADVEVESTADGTRRREPLSGCWNKSGWPQSGFASFRGHPNRPGLWWFVSTGEHVGQSCDVSETNVGTIPYYGAMVGISPAQADKTVQMTQRGVLVWTQEAWRQWMADHGSAVVNSLLMCG